MMFWGCTVKAKEEAEVVPYEEDFDYVHMSQVSLGADAKDGERVFVSVRHPDSPFDDEDEEEDTPGDDSPAYVLGVLSKGKTDFMSLDLVFDRPFKLFHSGSGTLHFSGYKTKDPANEEDDMDDDEFEVDEEEEEDEEDEEDEGVKPAVVQAVANGKSALAPPSKKAVAVPVSKPVPVSAKVAPSKAAAAAAAKRAAVAAAALDDDEDDEDDDDDDEDDDDDAAKGDDDLADASMDDIDDEDDEDDEDDDDDVGQKTKKQPVPAVKLGAKRPAPSTPQSQPKSVSAKKAKPATPGSAKSQQPAAGTPKVPAKAGQGAATTPPASGPKPSQPRPASTGGKGQPKSAQGKSPGNFQCTPCSKKFNSEQALQSHNKSKHAA